LLSLGIAQGDLRKIEEDEQSTKKRIRTGLKLHIAQANANRGTFITNRHLIQNLMTNLRYFDMNRLIRMLNGYL
jgi:hypothetical protein